MKASSQNIRTGIWATIGAIIIISSFGAYLSYTEKNPRNPGDKIVSASGLHWHPEVTIYVKGVKQEIPTDIGIGVSHEPMHTHDTSGQIHLEFSGMVREKDLTLGRFFKNWGKDISSFGTLTDMTVNGSEITADAGYVLRDKDKVELYYE